MNIKVRKSNGKVVSCGCCDFVLELGTEFEQFDVDENEVVINKLMRLDEFDIVRTGDGLYVGVPK